MSVTRTAVGRQSRTLGPIRLSGSPQNREEDGSLASASRATSAVATDAETETSLLSSDDDHPEAGPSSALAIVNGRLVRGTEKRYACKFDGCTKSYRKPSRLEEHERSHTGDRPFQCPTCQKSYLRESHLQAHSRSHQPESSRPLKCSVGGCLKRFWTAQHLRVHEAMHEGDRPFKCSHDECHESFSKHSQLRAHFTAVHCPAGTKPYRCDHSGCSKSFATNQKLKAHVKTHDDCRYTCSEASCVQKSGHKIHFGTWTALRTHIRVAHPPTCPYPTCNGKTFTAQKGLRAHMKIHEQMEIEEQLAVDAGSEDEDGQHVRKRRRGGEIGRDWKCSEDDCSKDFKSKKALQTHVSVTHLQRRDFACIYEGCNATFGYKHLLQRHTAKLHTVIVVEGTQDESPESQPDPQHDTNGTKDPATFNIDMLTGKKYLDDSTKRLANGAALQCPFPNIPPTFMVQDANQISGSLTESSQGCQYVFKRAYDLRRHLQTAHELTVDKLTVDKWVRSVANQTL